MNILQTLAWRAIKEGIELIERNPIDTGVQLAQLQIISQIISKYTDELKRTIKYDNEQKAKLTQTCCGQ